MGILIYLLYLMECFKYAFNILTVSDGMFLSMHLIYLLYLMECFNYVFNILVVSDGIYS